MAEGEQNLSWDIKIRQRGLATATCPNGHPISDADVLAGAGLCQGSIGEP